MTVSDFQGEVARDVAWNAVVVAMTSSKVPAVRSMGERWEKEPGATPFPPFSTNDLGELQDWCFANGLT